jgi:hypothetical protein
VKLTGIDVIAEREGDGHARLHRRARGVADASMDETSVHRTHSQPGIQQARHVAVVSDGDDERAGAKPEGRTTPHHVLKRVEVAPGDGYGPLGSPDEVRQPMLARKVRIEHGA